MAGHNGQNLNNAFCSIPSDRELLADLLEGILGGFMAMSRSFSRHPGSRNLAVQARQKRVFPLWLLYIPFNYQDFKTPPLTHSSTILVA